MNQLKDEYLTWRRRILTRIVRRRIDLSDVSLISMNCIGGILYHDCEQMFLSPTVNLYFTAPDFIKFINHLDTYLNMMPNVVMGDEFPVGTLGDIKIYFMHFDTPEQACEKWEERKTRINRDKIFVIMVEKEGFDDEVFEAFQRIPYPKFLFTRSEKYKCPDSLYMPRYKNEPELPNIIPGRHMYDGMKLVNAIRRSYCK